jgi:hypothetical protein
MPFLNRLALCGCALALAACGVSTSPTAASTGTTSTTPLVSPTQTGTPAPTNTATPRFVPTRDPNITPIPVIPCSLISAVEASAVLGAPVGDARPTPGGCLYFDSSVGQYVLSYFVLPAEYSAQSISGHITLLNSFGAHITTAQTTDLQNLALTGDILGVLEGLAAPLANPVGYTVARDNIADGSLWVSREASFVRQGMLLVARGDSLIGVDLVVTSARDDVSLRVSALSLAGQLLERLPEHFTLLTASSQPSPTLPFTTLQPTTVTSPQPSPAPGTTVPASATSQPTLTSTRAPVTSQPTLKPPAFSVPILSSDTLFYGGTCGSNLQTVTVKVIDASGISPIASVAVIVRLVGQGGETAGVKALPMRSEGANVWLRTLIVEQDLLGYEDFTNAAIEYYFFATNGAGVSAESLHYGLTDVPLRLLKCPQGTATVGVTATP